jgi:hypothetical protein
MGDFNANTKFIYTTSEGDFEFDIAPIGGDETEQNISRSKKTDGMVLNTVQNLEFVQGVKDLIVSEWNKKGTDASFKVTKKEKYFNDFFTVNSNYLLFDSLKWNKISATADFVDSSFDSVLRDNIREKFELDRTTDINNNSIPTLEKQTLLWKPRNIFKHSEFVTGDNVSDTYFVNLTFTPLMNVSVRSDEDVVSVFDPFVIDITTTTDLSVTNMFLYEATRAKTLTIKVDVHIEVSIYTSCRLNIYRYSDGLVYEETIPIGSLFTTSGEDVIYTGEIVVEVPNINDSLMFGMFVDSGTYTVNVIKSEITVEEDSFYEPLDPDDQYIDCLTLKNAFTRIVEILDPEVEFVSSILDDASSLTAGTWSDVVITGGETIRHVIYTEDDSQLNNLPPILTTSFEELYNAVFSIEPVAYTIITENGKTKLYLEAIDYVFDTEEAVDIGQLNDVEKSINSERTYSAVRIGSTTTGDTEEIFGLQAFNTTNVYQLPLKGDNTYEATTKYITDPNWAELTYRKQHSEYPDINHKNDKDVFMFDCKKFNVHGVIIYTPHIWSEHFSAVSGIYDVDSAYNYNFSPINCTFRHAKNFKQEYTKEQYLTSNLVYSSTDGNPSLKTTLTGGTQRAESGTFLLSIMDDPMYTNLKIEGHAAFNRAIRDVINSGIKPNYLKTFIWTDENGNKSKAFAYDIGINKEKMEFELVEKYR